MPARFCRATRRNLVLALLLAAVYAFYSDHAAGQIALEIKPIPTLLALAHEGSGVGAGLEVQASPHWSLFADASYLDVAVSRGEAEGQDRVALSRVQQDAALGVRYYGLPSGSSWYLGVKLGGGESHVVWSDRSALLTNERLTILTEEVQAGYRWDLASGVLVRLGFGANWTQAGDTNTPGAAVDLGVGYGF